MNKYTRIRDFDGALASGVGSSDIPILAGLHRHYGSTTLKLWEQKTGRGEKWNGNERTRVGHDLEAYVVFRFVEEKFGEDIAADVYKAKLRDRSSGPFKAMTEARSPEKPFCIAHADVLVDGQILVDRGDDGPVDLPDAPFIIEAKTVGAYAGKRREGRIFTGYDQDDRTAQGIPDAVFLQVQWQLLCYGVEFAYVAALIDNQYSSWGPIEADTRVQAKCLALAERFWRLVSTDTAPTPETWDDVQRLFPEQTDTTVMIAGDQEADVREMIARDKSLADRAKAIDEERDDIKNAIGVLLGESSVLSSGSGDILAKSSETTRESVVIMAREKDIKKAQARKSPPPLTEEEGQILELAAAVRELGLVTKSSFRQVRF